MKIATWNLQRSRPNSAKAARQREWIKSIDADIWILTETHLGLSPGENYQSVSSGLPEHPAALDERWVQIWARGGELTPLETSDEARTAAALLTTEAGRWLIYGTVLPWLGSTWRSHPAADGAAFTAALEVQRNDWQRLQQAFPAALLVVAGDFNQDLNDQHYYGSRRNKLALREALDSTGLECHTAGENDPARQFTEGQHETIDHICLPRALRDLHPQAFAWPPQWEDLQGVSDHFGTGVEVNLPAQ